MYCFNTYLFQVPEAPSEQVQGNHSREEVVRFVCQPSEASSNRSTEWNPAMLDYIFPVVAIWLNHPAISRIVHPPIQDSKQVSVLHCPGVTGRDA
jgi:hypothetical protein